mgnify:CR=1 FL=1|tara:strand:- start:359 stop:538 length:180 start_codon:yes stop_codon:yes gene_type:complete
MQLLKLSDRIKNRKPYNSLSGTINRIFEIYERDGKHIDGTPYVFIKPDVEDKKLKKSLN